jgi:hypothetical protein
MYIARCPPTAECGPHARITDGTLPLSVRSRVLAKNDLPSGSGDNSKTFSSGHEETEVAPNRSGCPR